MALFNLFKKSTHEDERARAVAAYEKVVSLTSNGHEARSMRLRMSMLCRAHLDKTFVAGAQQTEAHEMAVMLAHHQGTEKPEPPRAPLFQKVKSTNGEVMVYLPREFTDEAFALGTLYQKEELSAQAAIDAAQRLADRICFDALKLSDAFVALQFLRDELAGEGGEAGERDEPPVAEGQETGPA